MCGQLTGRDSSAQTIYERCFKLLIQHMNAKVYPSPGFISLLFLVCSSFIHIHAHSLTHTHFLSLFSLLRIQYSLFLTSGRPILVTRWQALSVSWIFSDLKISKSTGTIPLSHLVYQSYYMSWLDFNGLMHEYAKLMPTFAKFSTSLSLCLDSGQL